MLYDFFSPSHPKGTRSFFYLHVYTLSPLALARWCIRRRRVARSDAGRWRRRGPDENDEVWAVLPCSTEPHRRSPIFLIKDKNLLANAGIKFVLLSGLASVKPVDKTVMYISGQIEQMAGKVVYFIVKVIYDKLIYLFICKIVVLTCLVSNVESDSTQ